MKNKVEKTKDKKKIEDTQSQRNAMKNNDVQMRQSHVSVDCSTALNHSK